MVELRIDPIDKHVPEIPTNINESERLLEKVIEYT